MPTTYQTLTVARTRYSLTVFGDWLREQRKRAGMSQDDLAGAADISKSYISTLERGKHHTVTGAPPQPTMGTVTQLATALGISVEEAVSVAFRPSGYMNLERAQSGPHPHYPPGYQPSESREIADDLLDEFDRTYFRFEGDAWFKKLTATERITAVKRIIEEAREREK